MSNPTPSFVTHPVKPVAPFAKAPFAKAPLPAVKPAPASLSASYGYPETSSYGRDVSANRWPYASTDYGYPESSSRWPSTAANSFVNLKYAKSGNNPPAPPAITTPTVNGVIQTELPHMPPGYSYR